MLLEFLGSDDRATPEKTSFLLTCNLLSQYLKEKGSLDDLDLGMSFDSEKGMPIAKEPPIKTMNLFPAMIPNNGDISNPKSKKMARNIKSMDLFPQHSGFGPSISKDEIVSNTTNYSVNNPAPEASQMTILYNGQVMVFDDISADIAKEITLFASRASYQDPSIFASTLIHRQEETPNTTDMNSVNNKLIERLANDLPIARKASLTRFLEKRKDRILARAPYQKSYYSKVSPPEENNKSWLGLSPQSPTQQ